MSFRRYTTDISAIVNEILARPGWGRGGKSIGFSIRNETPEGGNNYLTVEDSTHHPAGCRGDQAAKLELFPTVRSSSSRAGSAAFFISLPRLPGAIKLPVAIERRLHVMAAVAL